MTRRPLFASRTRCALRLQGKLRALSIWDATFARAHIFYLWEADDARKVNREASWFAIRGPGYYCSFGDSPTLEMLARRAPAAHRRVGQIRRGVRPRPDWPRPSAAEVISAVLSMVTAGVGIARDVRGMGGG